MPGEQLYPTDPSRFFARVVEGPSAKPGKSDRDMAHLSPAELLKLKQAEASARG